MSDFSTFFPGGGGEGAGINSYASYKINDTVNDNPQGYNYITGLYTNPVDESVWLKTGRTIMDTVTPSLYPNAFLNPVATENVETRELNQTGVDQSTQFMALAADYRVGFKNYYLLFNRTGGGGGIQKAYKLDSTGTLIGSSITVPDLSSGGGGGIFAEPLGAGFSASGNSNAGSVWIIYKDSFYGQLYVGEYDLTFTTVLNQYNLGANVGGVTSPQSNILSATWCENAKLIYLGIKEGSYTLPVSNYASLYSWNPATNAYANYQIENVYAPYTNPTSVGTNPLTGQIAIGNFPSQQFARYTRLFNKPASSPLSKVSPAVQVGDSAFQNGPTSCSQAIAWLNPTAVAGSINGASQSLSVAYQSLPGGTSGPNLNALVTAASFGEITPRTDSSGSGQPLFIKLK
jgi:hypothetical protein